MRTKMIEGYGFDESQSIPAEPLPFSAIVMRTSSTLWFVPGLRDKMT